MHGQRCHILSAVSSCHRGSLLSAQVLWQIRFERHSKHSSSMPTSYSPESPGPMYLSLPACTYPSCTLPLLLSSTQEWHKTGRRTQMWKWQCNLFFSSSTKAVSLLPPLSLSLRLSLSASPNAFQRICCSEAFCFLLFFRWDYNYIYYMHCIRIGREKACKSTLRDLV